MKSVAKSNAQIRVLKERLEQRFAGSSTIDTVRQLSDANGWAMLICSDGGTETAGNPVIAIRIKAVDAVSKDVFGNALVAFGPHELEVAFELDGTEGEPSRRDLIKVMAEVGKIGMKIIVKEIADATAVSEASLDAAAVADVLESEVTWPSHGI